MEGKNSTYTKQYNRRRILGLLQREPMSRAELARQMGLTRAAISLITEELIADGLIRESKRPLSLSGPGRTPTALRLCEGACYSVGISLGRRHIRIGIEDLCGDIVTAREVKNHSLEGLLAAVKELLNCVPREKLLGIGISAPGPVDSATGTILNPTNFALWSNCPICARLEEAFGLPAYLENDANASALFNRRYNDFEEKDNFLLLYVGVGVGSGVISQGRLLRRCEVGHTSIDFNGPTCSCGNRGCLELYAAPDQLLKQFPQYQSLDELLHSPDVEAALEMEAQYLAAAIINFSNMIPVNAVLLEGQFHPCFEELLPMISKLIEGRILNRQDIRLLPALYTEHTQVQSACSIVFNHYLNTQ